MKTVAQQLYDYIDQKKGCEVITLRGVTVSVEDEDTLRAEFTFLETDNASLSVSYRSEKKAFVDILGISKIKDIHEVTPVILMELYYEGLAEIVCFVAIEYMYCMSFQKLGKVIIAENDRAVIHGVPVKKILETPDNFVSYAKQYYSLRECCEN